MANAAAGTATMEIDWWAFRENGEKYSKCLTTIFWTGRISGAAIQVNAGEQQHLCLLPRVQACL